MSPPEHQERTAAAGSVTPVILCGGSGTRLWPLSRPEAPKPFLPLIGDQSLFQQTLERCRDSGFASPLIVTGAAHSGLALEQSKGFDVAEIIVEPEAKQTAAAIALAALRLGEDAVMLICPSDHYIADCEAFAEAVVAGAKLAEAGFLVCVTVTASSPQTGFGYVRRGEPVDERGHRVASFVEKPDAATAARLIEGGAAWNAGIFLFRARSYLEELRRFRPDIAEAAATAVGGGVSKGRLYHPAAGPMSAIDPQSVDYAVMEKTAQAAMVEAQMGWSDIGTWSALHLARERDASGNSIRGDAELVDCRNVAVDSDGPRLHCRGLENMLVVAAGGDVLVAPLN